MSARFEWESVRHLSRWSFLKTWHKHDLLRHHLGGHRSPMVGVLLLQSIQCLMDHRELGPKRRSPTPRSSGSRASRAEIATGVCMFVCLFICLFVCFGQTEKGMSFLRDKSMGGIISNLPARSSFFFRSRCRVQSIHAPASRSHNAWKRGSRRCRRYVVWACVRTERTNASVCVP